MKEKSVLIEYGFFSGVLKKPANFLHASNTPHFSGKTVL